MDKNRRILIPIVIILILAVVAYWYLIRENSAQAASNLTGSGSVEAVEVNLSPEIAGKVSEVLVAEGDRVTAGQPVLRLDDELLQGQRARSAAALDAAKANLTVAQAGVQQAQAGLSLAQANLEAAKAASAGAESQYQATLTTARQADKSARDNAWQASQPSEFDQPVWFFERSEEISATQTEIDSARSALDQARQDYHSLINSPGHASFAQVEKRLVTAQYAFLVAKDLLDQAQRQSGQEVRDAAQANFDSAKAELDAAQSDYDRELSDQNNQDIRDARAHVAVYQARLDLARDRLASLQTGEFSPQVQAADAARRQAQAGVSQAEAGVQQAQANLDQAKAKQDQASSAANQAQADLDLIDTQISKLTVYASEAGVITDRSVEPGEVVQPGVPALVLSQLDQLKLTVYLPEDRYGQLKVGDQAWVTVDSYPGERFAAAITRIADRAEFTPRNVQTVEGRSTTVYAIELTLENLEGKLKPGMPADVTFASD